MKILVVDDERELREIIALILEGEFRCEVVLAASGQEAISALRQDRDISVVFSDYNMSHGNGGTVFSYLRKEHPEVPFILCSSLHYSKLPEFSNEAPNGFLGKPFEVSSVAKVVRESIGDAGKFGPTEPVPPYFQLRVGLAEKLSGAPADLYVRISDDHYVRVFKSGEALVLDDITRFSGRKIETFFFRSADIANVTKALSEALLPENAEPKTPTNSFGSLAAAHQFAADSVAALGVTPENEALIRSAVELSVTSISAHPTLAGAFNKMSENLGYNAVHSILLGYVSAAISSLLGWNSKDVFLKLAMAAFLHDITIRDDELAKVASLSELKDKESQFTDSQILSYEQHPKKASLLLQEFPEVSPDVAVIVRQHHERPDGSGFPNRLDALRILPLAAVFIVGEDLVSRILENRDLAELPRAVRNLVTLYPDGLFKQIALKAEAGCRVEE